MGSLGFGPGQQPDNETRSGVSAQLGMLADSMARSNDLFPLGEERYC
jgi:hypothetical protein